MINVWKLRELHYAYFLKGKRFGIYLLALRVLATDPEVRVRFSAVQDFLRSSGSGTGSTQPREYNWGATWKKNSGSGLESREYGRRDSSRWPHGTFYPQKLALTWPTSGGRLVGIVRSRTQATAFSLAGITGVLDLSLQQRHFLLEVFERQ
jgi:hypothetical protein